jgi:hypothetical protein
MEQITLLRNGNTLSTTWRPPVGPEKGRFFSYFTPYPAPIISNLLVGSLLVRTIFSPQSMSLIGPFLSAFFPQTPKRPPLPSFCRYSPEHGDSMFLRNAGIDLRNHTAPKPNTTPISHYTSCSVSYEKVPSILWTVRELQFSIPGLPLNPLYLI